MESRFGRNGVLLTVVTAFVAVWALAQEPAKDNHRPQPTPTPTPDTGRKTNTTRSVVQGDDCNLTYTSDPRGFNDPALDPLLRLLEREEEKEFERPRYLTVEIKSTADIKTYREEWLEKPDLVSDEELL